jgi:hypothetical protein
MPRRNRRPKRRKQKTQATGQPYQPSPDKLAWRLVQRGAASTRILERPRPRADEVTE